MTNTTNLPPLPEPEDFPEGKALWLAVCETRKVPPDRAEQEWRYWDGDFMTKGEWQMAATLYARAAILQERERCAKVCEEVAMPVENHEGKIWWNAAVGQCTAAIWEGDK